MKREFSVMIERDSEGYYVATVPALRGCHTQARSMDKLLARIKEAIELCLEVEGSDVTPSGCNGWRSRMSRLRQITGRQMLKAL